MPLQYGRLCGGMEIVMRDYFSGLYGNNALKKRLGEAIIRDTLPHAFLIVGPDGSGKRTLAAELVAALNCEKRHSESSPLPCHTCNTCRRIKEGNYTDITYLSRAAGKATIGVEEVRLFREGMFLSATESEYKLYVICEAEKLTPQAQNALLTVLEEPPRNVVILLLAETADSILTTIKSRTQSITMQRFDSASLLQYLTAHNEKARLYAKSSSELLDGIIMSSDGRIGKAIELLSDKESLENQESRALIERIIAALSPAAPYSQLYAALSELPTARADFSEAIESLMCALRDIILVKFDRNAPLIFYTSPEAVCVASEDLNTKRLFKIYEILKCALEDAGRNVGTSAIIADLGAKIKLL